MPGSSPLVQLAPESVLVAQPMSEAPPSVNRPVCWASTMVEPKEKVSGSTSVACWLEELVNGSVLSSVSVTFACAVVVPIRSAPPANRVIKVARCFVGMRDPASV